MKIEILETDMSIFQDKEKAIQFFSAKNQVSAFLLSYATEDLVEVGLIGVEDKRHPFIEKRGRFYCPLSLDIDNISLFKKILNPFYERVLSSFCKVSSSPVAEFQYLEEDAKKIVRQELKHFGYHLSDVPQDILPTSRFHKSMPHKYLSELFFVRGDSYRKEKIPHIKKFYQLINNSGYTPLISLGKVPEDYQESNLLYEKNIMNYPKLNNLLTNIKNNSLSTAEADFLSLLTEVLIDIYRVE